MDLWRDKTKELRRVGVRIDWKATFYAFCEAHGGLPVKHAGRLLFPDGWGYALDYRGPEYPPPRDAEGNPDEEALLHLRIAYCREKRRLLRFEVAHFGDLVSSFDDMQKGRSVRIQSMRKTDDMGATGNPQWASGDAEDEISLIRSRLKWARSELVTCEKELEALEEQTVKQELERVAQDGERVSNGKQR